MYNIYKKYGRIDATGKSKEFTDNELSGKGGVVLTPRERDIVSNYYKLFGRGENAAENALLNIHRISDPSDPTGQTREVAFSLGGKFAGSAIGGIDATSLFNVEAKGKTLPLTGQTDPNNIDVKFSVKPAADELTAVMEQMAELFIGNLDELAERHIVSQFATGETVKPVTLAEKKNALTKWFGINSLGHFYDPVDMRKGNAMTVEMAKRGSMPTGVTRTFLGGKDYKNLYHLGKRGYFNLNNLAENYNQEFLINKASGGAYRKNLLDVIETLYNGAGIGNIQDDFNTYQLPVTLEGWKNPNAKNGSLTIPTPEGRKISPKNTTNFYSASSIKSQYIPTVRDRNAK